MNLINFFKSFFKKKSKQRISVEDHINNQLQQIEVSNEDWSGNDYIFDKKPKKKVVIRTKGVVYDLKKIYNRLNKEHFNGEMKLKITYGRYGCKNVKRRKSITFGTYSDAEKLIRIHPALDSKEIPLYFIEHVIHHEMLHNSNPPFWNNGKWQIHHYEFRVAEANTPTYNEAIKWEIKNAHKIFFN